MVVSRKRRSKYTLKSYDRCTNKYDLRLTIKGDGKVKRVVVGSKPTWT